MMSKYFGTDGIRGEASWIRTPHWRECAHGDLGQCRGLAEEYHQHLHRPYSESGDPSSRPFL